MNDSSRQSGHITKWNAEKGFGFIRAEDGREYFFHRSAVQGDVDTIQTQQPVTFVPTTSLKGPRAESVQFA